MFEKLPTIHAAEKLLDIALKKTKKIQIPDRNSHYRQKKTLIAKTESFSTTLTTKLSTYVTQFPSIDQLPLFYQELLHIQFDINKLKQALGAVQWAKKTIEQITSKQLRAMKRTGNLVFLKQKHKEIIGRVSSVLHQINPHLLFLIDAVTIMRKLPTIQDIPTIVIAGSPNVGKSSLLTQLSHAKPQISHYPFTTKQIYIGHIQTTERFETKQYQLIDTPGLLDRPLQDRNPIEQQAIAALKHLADVILFISDPTETCGYSNETQHQTLKEIQHLFKAVPIIQVENKSDLLQTTSSAHKISCKTGDGIQNLRETILQTMKKIDEK